MLLEVTLLYMLLMLLRFIISAYLIAHAKESVTVMAKCGKYSLNLIYRIKLSVLECFV